MHHYDVPSKAMKGRTLLGKLGMTIFFRRYRTLESANFPWKTKASLTCLAMAAFSIYYALIAAGPEASFVVKDLSWAVAMISLILFFCLSFIFTAPTIGRLTYVRRAYLILIHYVLCRFMESIEWCTGTNKTGYMMHLTATKLVTHEYLSKQELEETTTMAIVRNPYSRMVSIYNYNKFGNAESFQTFVQDWYARMTKPYRETGELDEWYTPCHTIPQFEFTHDARGNEMVQCIIKQEDLKLLKKNRHKEGISNKDDEHDDDNDDEEAGRTNTKSSVSNLPDIVSKALLDMPHTNSRAGGKKWHEYYTQETLDLVYEMYQTDFEVFGYSPLLEQRSDLQAPKLYKNKNKTRQEECEEEEAQFVNEHDNSGRTEHSDNDKELQDVPLRSSNDKEDDDWSSISPPQLESSLDSSTVDSGSEDEDEISEEETGSQSRFDIQTLEA